MPVWLFCLMLPKSLVITSTSMFYAVAYLVFMFSESLEIKPKWSGLFNFFFTEKSGFDL